MDSLFENKELMETLTSEINSKININQDDQTLVNNSEGDLAEASENDDKQ